MPPCPFGRLTTAGLLRNLDSWLAIFFNKVLKFSVFQVFLIDLFRCTVFSHNRQEIHS